MAIKTYVLLDVMDSTAPIYQTLGNGQRSQIKKIPFYRPYLDIEVIDKEGTSKRLRYKSTSPYLFADEQLEKNKIEANAKFTDGERSDLMFRHGTITTNKERAQKHLEAYPAFEGSPYTSDSVKRKEYKLLDLAGESKIKNEDLKRRIKAANKIMELKTIEEAQSLMFRINGSFFEAPKDVDECQNQLIEWLDQAEDAGIELLMKDDGKITVDEKAMVLIGELLTAEILSFDAKENEISKKDKDGKWVAVRNLSSTEYNKEQRQALFMDFLNTEDGKHLKNDLEKDLSEFKKKSKQDSKPKT